MKVWKQIKNYENYEVSNEGDVRNIRTGTVLHQRIGLGGYKTVMLYSKLEHKNVCRRVHRLVADTFLDNPNGLPEVDHFDHDKFNNNFTNLRWVTKKENLLNRKWCKPVAMCDKETNEIIRIFNTITDAADYLSKQGKSFSAIRVAICQACQGNRPSAYGYNWRYTIKDFSEEAKADFWEECNTVKAYADKHSDIMTLASEIKN